MKKHLLVVLIAFSTLFSFSQGEANWQGTVDNDPSRVCAQGMYIWKVKFREEENNQLQIVIGEVNLIR